jgi:peptidoglycan hydrolase CwlO-like protein
MSSSDLVKKKKVLTKKLEKYRELIDGLEKQKSETQKKVEGVGLAAFFVVGFIVMVIYEASTGSSLSLPKIISTVGWGGFILFFVACCVFGLLIICCCGGIEKKISAEIDKKQRKYDVIEIELKEIEDQLAQIPSTLSTSENSVT